MKQLLNLKFFSLLSENAVNNQGLTELQDAYEEFALTIHERLETGLSMSKLYYEFSFILLEMKEIQSAYSGRQEKKCFYFCNKSHIINGCPVKTYRMAYPL